ncbi:hypothetical protein TELCIR_17680, partial [Teladorsagia circumcincta]
MLVSYSLPQKRLVTKLQIGLNLLQRCKTALILLGTPLVFSPLMLSPESEWRCAFCVGVMAVYWMTEVLPLAVTAMLPVILFPLTNVMDSKETALQFINDTNFLFIGGLIMAAAVEKCDLHERVALSVLKMVGGEPKCMFISNTATTAMMVPIGQSVIGQLVASYNSHPENGMRDKAACKRMSTGLMLCICIAANIGGTGTITGTPSNLVMIGSLN